MHRQQNAAQDNIHSTGLKATTPRVKILQVLRQSPIQHLSVEDIFRKLHEAGTDIGLATVYRVLNQFEQAGLLVRSHFDGGKAVYELNEGSHHDHIVCQSCGRVDEFHDDDIERLQEQIAASRGYELRDHSLALYGLCARCAS
ncbi:MAG: ferric iron uptake transcriptional regulator [Aquabacterium sp.]